MSNPFTAGYVDHQQEITTYIMWNRVITSVSQLDERMMAIEEALKSVCGSVEALATGLKVLADEQNRPKGGVL